LRCCCGVGAAAGCPNAASVGAAAAAAAFVALLLGTGFVEPGATYRVDLTSPQPHPELFRATRLKVPHDPAGFETKQVCRGRGAA
jgi:hypothetical protein